MNDLFLELTHVKKDNIIRDEMYGQTIFISPTDIVSVMQMIDSEENVYTSIFLKGPASIEVIETPQEIADKIKELLMMGPEEGEF